MYEHEVDSTGQSLGYLWSCPVAKSRFAGVCPLV